MLFSEASRTGCAVLAAVLWLGGAAQADAASDGREEREQEDSQGAGAEAEAEAETGDIGDAEKAVETEKAAEAEKRAEDAEPRQRSPDVFIPSEDISEDFAVPFPVDI